MNRYWYGLIFWIALLFAGAFGWGWNIVKLSGMDTLLNGIGILRIVGIFVAPLGAIVGYL